MEQLIRLLRASLESNDWARLRTSGGTAERVPERFLALVSAQSHDDAERWYWTLDNGVVVQGRAFWSAHALLHSIVAALSATCVTPPARRWLAELLTEITLAGGHEDEEQAGVIASQIAEVVRQNRGLCIALAADPDERVRRCALEIIWRVETDPGSLSAFMSAMRDDPDPKVRTIASRGD